MQNAVSKICFYLTTFLSNIYCNLLLLLIYCILLVFYYTLQYTEHRPHGRSEVPVLPRSESTADIQPLEDNEVEYFFASDASAVIEHTNRVIYFEVSL